jgi:2-oxoglutarate dehydrogenase E2 component (dihydrolipoamide succinyltransferase)
MPTPDDAAQHDPPSSADAADGEARDAAADPNDTLSPAVRRLVRQFDLDVTGIHGTGPEGRIRVGDVMNVLGNRTDSGNRDAPRRREAREPSDESSATHDAAKPVAPSQNAPQAATNTAPTTTVFDCDLSRVLVHRKQQRQTGDEPLLASYCLVALAEAQRSLPELTQGASVRFGVVLAGADGEPRVTVLDSMAEPRASLDERLHAFDEALRSTSGGDATSANLLVHHYGQSGSVLATSMPLGASNAASIGIGRVRREVVIRVVDGAEAVRAASHCYLSLSFLAERLPLHRANRFMADAVRILERWPLEPQSPPPA